MHQNGQSTILSKNCTSRTPQFLHCLDHTRVVAAQRESTILPRTAPMETQQSAAKFCTVRTLLGVTLEKPSRHSVDELELRRLRAHELGLLELKLQDHRDVNRHHSHDLLLDLWHRRTPQPRAQHLYPALGWWWGATECDECPSSTSSPSPAQRPGSNKCQVRSCHVPRLPARAQPPAVPPAAACEERREAVNRPEEKPGALRQPARRRCSGLAPNWSPDCGTGALRTGNPGTGSTSSSTMGRRTRSCGPGHGVATGDRHLVNVQGARRLGWKCSRNWSSTSSRTPSSPHLKPAFAISWPRGSRALCSPNQRLLRLAFSLVVCRASCSSSSRRASALRSANISLVSCMSRWPSSSNAHTNLFFSLTSAAEAAAGGDNASSVSEATESVAAAGEVNA